MSKEDCGCTVSQSRDGKSYCIGFCPLHSAAQEMLNALKAVSLHLLVRPENRMPIADQNVAAIVRAAITKAEAQP